VIWHRQLPAYSPLSIRALLAGAAGCLAGAEAARAAVTAALAQTFATDEILLTDSGTGALTLGIRACLGRFPGASVALPAYGCYDLATAADGARVPVVLYDVEPEALSPEIASLRRALAAGARTVVLVHLYGVPVDPGPMRDAMHATGALLIEDAAQGAGAEWQGRPLGSFGDLTVLSFGRGKGCTAGRGGALLARGADAAAEIAAASARTEPARRGLTDLVPLAAQWLLGRPSLYAVPSSLPFLQLGETVYRDPGAVRPMSDVAVSTLTTTLALSEQEANVRLANAARLLERPGRDLTPVAVPSGAKPGYLRLPFLAAPAVRARAGSSAARALGIMPGYPRALCDLPGFAERVVNRGDAFPGARALAERLITLPTHGLLDEADLSRLEGWLASGGG